MRAPIREDFIWALVFTKMSLSISLLFIIAMGQSVLYRTFEHMPLFYALVGEYFRFTRYHTYRRFYAMVNILRLPAEENDIVIFYFEKASKYRHIGVISADDAIMLKMKYPEQSDAIVIPFKDK